MVEGLTARQVVTESQEGRLPGWNAPSTVSEDVFGETSLIRHEVALTLVSVDTEAEPDSPLEERLRILEVTCREGQSRRQVRNRAGESSQPTDELLSEYTELLTETWELRDQRIDVPAKVMTDDEYELLPAEFDVVADLWGHPDQMRRAPSSDEVLGHIVTNTLAWPMGMDLERLPRPVFNASLATLIYGNEWIGNREVEGTPQPVYGQKAVWGVVVATPKDIKGQKLVPEDGCTPTYRDVHWVSLEAFRQHAVRSWQGRTALEGGGLALPASCTSVWDTTQLLSHLPDEYLEALGVERPEPYESWPVMG